MYFTALATIPRQHCIGTAFWLGFLAEIWKLLCFGIGRHSYFALEIFMGTRISQQEE